MKRIFSILALVLTFTSLNAQLLTEDFNFSGAVIGVNGWVGTATPSATPAVSTTTGLTYTDFSGSGIGNAVSLAASGEDLAKPLSASITSGSVYLTFMVNVSAATTTVGGYITGFTSTTLTTYNLRLYVKAVTGGIDFGVARSSGTPVVYTGNTYNLNQTYLITCKYTIGTVATFDDVASIYIHPSTPTLVEPATMSATFSGGASGSDASNISNIFIRQGTAADNIVAVVDGFRAATDWSPTIPVELVDFKAQKANSAVNLVWQTATELNNAYFNIERSFEGKSFEKIGEVIGYGNSNLNHSYSFVDEKPSSSINYYRLRQVDFNGKETIYKTVSVNFSKDASIKVFPTIVKDKLTVEVNATDKSSELTIVNLLGQVVKSQKLQNTEGSVSFDISDLTNGSYIVRYTSKSGNLTQRFEKQ